MILRFLARDGFLEPDPRYTRIPGQPCRRVGRDPDGTIRTTPDEFDAASPAGRRLLRVMTAERDPARRAAVAPLVPADKATADACGLPFQAVTEDGATTNRKANK